MTETEQKIQSFSNTEELEEYIKSRYEANALQKELDELETIFAERVSEEDLNVTEEDINLSEDIGAQGVSIENQLINMYQRLFNPENRWGMTKEDIVSNMRTALEDTGMVSGGFKEGISDKEILSAAKDSYERKKALIARYKSFFKIDNIKVKLNLERN